jgi:DNA-binding transcriptional LysR family regulator
MIREYRRRFPGVRLSLHEMAPASQFDGLRNGRLDVGFTRPVPATDGGFVRNACTAIPCSPSCRKGIAPPP